MENDYFDWGLSELVDRIETIESKLRVIVRDFDFSDPQKMQSEIIKLLDNK